MSLKLVTALLTLSALLATTCGIQKVDEDFPFTVKVEFVMYSIDMIEYPEMAPAFTRAVMDWTTVIPVEAFVFTQQLGNFGEFFGMPQPKDFTSIIHVHFVDMSLDRWENTGYIGAWVPGEWTLYMDGNSLTGKPELAYNVAMHELGHVFGMPHIVPQSYGMGRTGDISIPESDQPETYLMFPGASLKNAGKFPSDIAIEITTNYIVNTLNIESLGHYRKECHYSIE